MATYATISVPSEVKKLLERAKGDDEWGKFLLNLYLETKSLKGKKAFEELANMLKEEDLKTLLESSKEFRERLALR